MATVVQGVEQNHPRLCPGDSKPMVGRHILFFVFLRPNDSELSSGVQKVVIIVFPASGALGTVSPPSFVSAFGAGLSLLSSKLMFSYVWFSLDDAFSWAFLCCRRSAALFTSGPVEERGLPGHRSKKADRPTECLSTWAGPWSFTIVG